MIEKYSHVIFEHEKNIAHSLAEIYDLTINYIKSDYKSYDNGLKASVVLAIKKIFIRNNEIKSDITRIVDAYFDDFNENKKRYQIYLDNSINKGEIYMALSIKFVDKFRKGEIELKPKQINGGNINLFSL